MNKTENISKAVFFVLVGYLIIWFWPVFFHHTLLYDKNEWADCYYNYNCRDYYPPTPVPSAPTYTPSYPVEPYVREGDVTNVVPVEAGDGSESNDPVACTMDAKVCADGSAVGRVAPDCEFAKCPEEK